jgi:hypothetical protein
MNIERFQLHTRRMPSRSRDQRLRTDCGDCTHIFLSHSAIRADSTLREAPCAPCRYRSCSFDAPAEARGSSAVRMYSHAMLDPERRLQHSHDFPCQGYRRRQRATKRIVVTSPIRFCDRLFALRLHPLVDATEPLRPQSPCRVGPPAYPH